MSADPTQPRKQPAMNNNPFKAVPLRPHRDDPVRDKWRDPVFYQAFGGDRDR